MSGISEEQLIGVERAFGSKRIRDLVAEIRRLRAENASLVPLAKLGLDATNQGGGDFESMEIYEKAVRHGVLVETTFDPDCHTDWNEEAVEGDDWAEFAPGILDVKRSLEKSS